MASSEFCFCGFCSRMSFVFQILIFSIRILLLLVHSLSFFSCVLMQTLHFSFCLLCSIRTPATLCYSSWIVWIHYITYCKYFLFLQKVFLSIFNTKKHYESEFGTFLPSVFKTELLGFHHMIQSTQSVNDEMEKERVYKIRANLFIIFTTFFFHFSHF